MFAGIRERTAGSRCHIAGGLQGWEGNKDRGDKLKAGPVWDFDWGTFVLGSKVQLD
ncbi:MAG: hypothetical protein ACLVL2_25015 [Bacteroides cellulosilyticus]